MLCERPVWHHLQPHKLSCHLCLRPRIRSPTYATRVTSWYCTRGSRNQHGSIWPILLARHSHPYWQSTVIILSSRGLWHPDVTVRGSLESRVRTTQVPTQPAGGSRRCCRKG